MASWELQTDTCRDHAAANATLVVYNRIPKCGSTTLIELLRHMQKGAGFTVFNSVAKEDYYMKEPFRPGTRWSAGWDKLRALAADGSRRDVYINHMAWPDLALAPSGLPAPHYMNWMREPVSRETSGYYYLMHGPRPADRMEASRRSRRKLLGGLDHTPDIDEFLTFYAAKWGEGCIQFNSTRGQMKGNLQTKLLCGHHPVCDDVCSEAALHRAKSVLTHQYVVVGVIERMEDSLALLGHQLPDWFAGIAGNYRTLIAAHSGHQRTHTGKHPPPSAESVRLLRSMHRQDVALYTHAVAVLEHKLKVCMPGSESF